MRRGCFAPPHFVLHRLCFQFQILSHIIGLQAVPTPLPRSLLISFSHKQQAPCFEITKSGSCRIHLLYPAQKCFDKRQKVLRGLQGGAEGQRALARRQEATCRLLKSTKELKTIWFYYTQPNLSRSTAPADTLRQWREEGIKDGRISHHSKYSLRPKREMICGIIGSILGALLVSSPIEIHTCHTLTIQEQI